MLQKILNIVCSDTDLSDILHSSSCQMSVQHSIITISACQFIQSQPTLSCSCRTCVYFFSLQMRLLGKDFHKLAFLQALRLPVNRWWVTLECQVLAVSVCLGCVCVLFVGGKAQFAFCELLDSVMWAGWSDGFHLKTLEISDGFHCCLSCHQKAWSEHHEAPCLCPCTGVGGGKESVEQWYQ